MSRASPQADQCAAFIVLLITLWSCQVQCTKPECRKWRQLTKEIQLTASLAATYRCGMKFNNIKVDLNQDVEMVMIWDI